MTADELRNVFHVEDHSLVPKYHLVQLIHHLARRNIPTSHSSNSIHNSGKIAHVKISQVWKTEPPSLLNDEMFIKAKEYIKDVDIIGDLNETVAVKFNVSNSSEISDSVSELGDTEHAVDDQDNDVHRMELEAFGRQLKLVLKKQEGLVKKDGVKMWRVLTNESQPHGVDYEETNSVSLHTFLFEFQSESNIKIRSNFGLNIFEESTTIFQSKPFGQKSHKWPISFIHKLKIFKNGDHMCLQWLIQS